MDPQREDSYKHKGQRKALAEQVRQKGIRDERIIEAIKKIPRHYFLPSTFDFHAYQDKAFPIGEGQTISQPYTVAFQTELLEVNKGDKVLEIGTGSGYQACVLMELGAKVFTVENHRKLFEKTKKLLTSMGYNPRFFYEDGSKGLPENAPFDRILLTAGAEAIPEKLLEQLAPDGIMVLPVGKEGTQKMIRVTKDKNGNAVTENFGWFSFVPLTHRKYS